MEATRFVDVLSEDELLALDKSLRDRAIKTAKDPKGDLYQYHQMMMAKRFVENALIERGYMFDGVKWVQNTDTNDNIPF